MQKVINAVFSSGCSELWLWPFVPFVVQTCESAYCVLHEEGEEKSKSGRLLPPRCETGEVFMCGEVKDVCAIHL